MSRANSSGPNGPLLAVLGTSSGAPPQVKKSQHAPPPWRNTTRSVLAGEPQLSASPVVLVPNWYSPDGCSAASVQNASSNGIQVHPAAPAIAAPSVREIGAPSGGGVASPPGAGSFPPP